MPSFSTALVAKGSIATAGSLAYPTDDFGSFLIELALDCVEFFSDRVRDAVVSMSHAVVLMGDLHVACDYGDLFGGCCDARFDERGFNTFFPVIHGVLGFRAWVILSHRRIVDGDFFADFAIRSTDCPLS